MIFTYAPQLLFKHVLVPIVKNIQKYFQYYSLKTYKI